MSVIKPRLTKNVATWLKRALAASQSRHRDVVVPALRVLYSMRDPYGDESQASANAFNAILRQELRLSKRELAAREKPLASKINALTSEKEKMLLAIHIPVLHAMRAINAVIASQRAEAIARCLEAKYWEGFVTSWAIMVRRETRQKQRAAERRHAEDRKLQAAVIEHWEKNKFPSYEQAAHVIVKLEPVKHRTITRWISDYEKEK